MGWTHYWRRESKLPVEAFEKAAKDCEVVLKNIHIPLAGPLSQSDPVFASDAIVFNGIKGQNCEPFSIKVNEQPRRPNKQVFSYCKTEKLPYDLCVKSALVILKHYLGDHLHVMSDGKQEDWFDAINTCKSCMGYGNDFILSGKD